MDKIKVLVTGVGAIIGYGIIQSLRSSDREVQIIGMDIYSDAVGRHWCDRFIQAVPAADNSYIGFLIDTIKTNNVDLVFFGTEQEIRQANASRGCLGEFIGKMVLNNPSIIKMADDKWLLNRFLLENGFEEIAIPSVIDGSYTKIASEFGIPFLLKPRDGYASKGIHKIKTHEEFEFYRKSMGDSFMAQKIVGNSNQEYTLSLFGLGDGTVSESSICFRRTLSGEGSTAKATVANDSDMRAWAQRLSAVLRPIGPTNFQFRKEEEQCYLLEINPRISSATSLRTAFGYNEASMCFDWYLDKKIPLAQEIRCGTAERYVADWIALT